MYTKEVKIINATGLHARPAAEFCKTAAQFMSNVSIKKQGEEKVGNGKSVISVMTMCLAQGTTIEISADGEDEMITVETLVALVESGFGEV
ncbi:MAG: HPr family phosphocarrier protein [Eubacteriaceae bacterium]